jgi:GntR family phosphonate transport system transcriptional regulator
VSTHFPARPTVVPFRPSVIRGRSWISVSCTDYRRRSTRILARPATAEEARLLRQPPTLPVLVTEAIDVHADGAPTSHALTAWASGRVQLTVDSG